MNPEWQQEFRERMRGFKGRNPAPQGDELSIKIRVVSGCFHREHSPQAYGLIDFHRGNQSPDVEFIEHESGPELLVYAAVATAGLTLAKSVIDLITTIIKARAEGVKKGDRPADPLELIVRRVNDGREFREEMVLRIGHTDKVDAATIEKQVDEALRKLSKSRDQRKKPVGRKLHGRPVIYHHFRTSSRRFGGNGLADSVSSWHRQNDAAHRDFLWS